MSKEIYISSTPHETRLAIVENDDLSEIYYERENEYTLAGSIYNGKVTRVLPGMQSSFVDIGLERDAFLYITDFMEEAGDSAEFDSSAAEGGSERRGRGDRNPRPRREGSAEAEPAPNGDNGRGRNAFADARRPSPSTSSVNDQETDGLIAAETREPSGVSEDAADGAPREAAPEGSRRWRGRRGRRRGRSGSEREPRTGATGSTATGETQDLVPGESDSFTDEESLELGAAAEDHAAGDAYTAGRSADTPSLHQEPEHLSESHEDVAGTRERGERRERRDRRPPRAPRGFTPSQALYGLEENREAADAPAGEPIVLPGESLAKYRGDAEPARTSATAAAPAPPSAAAAFALPGTWNGGDVMPGETIRPRGNASPVTGREASPRSGREDRREGGPRSDRRPDRRDRQGDRPADRRPDRRPDRSEGQRFPVAASPVPDTSPTEAFASLPEPAGILAGTPEASTVQRLEAPAFSTNTSSNEQVPAHSADAEPQGTWADASQTAEPTASPVSEAQPRIPDNAVTEPERLETEYEPADASASHRFDPVPPREYRQSAPVLGDEPVAGNSTTTSSSAFADATHSITPPPGVPLAPLVSEAAAAKPAETVEPAGHNLTAVTSEGDMLSEPAAAPSPQEIAAPTAPIHHETAVLEEPSTAIADFAAPEHAIGQNLGSGHAQLQPEDALDGDDEDGDSAEATFLHASSIEEIDYEEEETLEGAADLGSMIREMSIDEITGPQDLHEETLGEEEVDFEEEDASETAQQYSAFENDSAEISESPSEDQETRYAGESPDAQGFDEPGAATEAPASSNERQGREGNGEGRRQNRRDGRRSGREDRGRSTGGSEDRNGRSTGMRQGGRRDHHRHSAQTTNLPAISDLLKPGQELLVQIAKEPIAKKGARITSHIALPGRFLVFMPTVNHMGVSRKIESDGERRRLKEILLSEKGDATGGFIVRTAASGASEEELRSDLRFLLNLWADIKQRSESSKSPALIYHDLNLVERILRDQVTDNFSAIWVDTESEYERVLRFLQRFQPSLIRRVKLYTKETPLFEQFGLTEEINKALRSKVWLKSGGSIVINQTEALVAIDINTGKYVGKTARLEDTIVKTNLDAIPEIVRQIRLRDLGGIIIIDFIDMDERKNRHRVMAALEEELKKDRAPSKVLQFNDFGLVAITRKRVKQSLERTLSTTCNICTGTGMMKSPVTVCNEIYIEMRKMQKHLDRGDVMLRVNPEVVKQLKSPTARWLQEMEEMVGKTILVKSDPTLHPEQFDIH